MIFKVYCLLIIIIIAVIQDIVYFRIKNLLICIGLIVGVLFVLFAANFNYAVYHLVGAVLPILLLYPLFIIRAFGAGDIKLFSVIGLFLGSHLVLNILLISVLCGGVQSLLYLVRNKVIHGAFFQKETRFILQFPFLFQQLFAFTVSF